MTPMFVDEEKTQDILILGCDRGNVYKFVRPIEDKKAPWVKDGFIQCDQRVYDILQTKEH